MTVWRVGMRVRKFGSRDIVTLTQELGDGMWIGRGPNGETVVLMQTAEWEPAA